MKLYKQNELRLLEGQIIDITDMINPKEYLNEIELKANDKFAFTIYDKYLVNKQNIFLEYARGLDLNNIIDKYWKKYCNEDIKSNDCYNETKNNKCITHEINKDIIFNTKNYLSNLITKWMNDEEWSKKVIELINIFESNIIKLKEEFDKNEYKDIYYFNIFNNIFDNNNKIDSDSEEYKIELNRFFNGYIIDMVKLLDVSHPRIPEITEDEIDELKYPARKTNSKVKTCVKNKKGKHKYR